MHREFVGSGAGRRRCVASRCGLCGFENFRSDEMAKGVYFERMNRFGPHLVDDKGTESLKEAAKYRAWADQRVVEYPFTAVNVLIPLAEDFEAQAKREGESRRARRKAWQ